MRLRDKKTVSLAKPATVGCPSKVGFPGDEGEEAASSPPQRLLFIDLGLGQKGCDPPVQSEHGHGQSA